MWLQFEHKGTEKMSH